MMLNAMDREKQSLELDSLKNIFFSEEFQVLDLLGEDGLMRAVFWAFIVLPEDYVVKYLEALDFPEPSQVQLQYLPPIELRLTLPKNYPSRAAPKFIMSCQWLNRFRISKLCKKLDQIWAESGFSEVIYTWCCFLKNDTLPFLGFEKELDITDLCSKHLTFLKRIQKINKEKKKGKYQPIKTQVPNRGALDITDRPGTSQMQYSYGGCEGINGVLPKKDSFKTISFKPSFGQSSYDDRGILNLSLKMSPIKTLINYNAERSKVEFQRNFYMCNICFYDKHGKDCIQFQGCNHVFCVNCVKFYFTQKIQDGVTQPILCPEDRCYSEALPSQVKEVVSEELFNKYDEMLLKCALNSLSDIIICPRKICQFPVWWNTNEEMANCPNCQYVFCVHCKMLYHGVQPCNLNRVQVEKLVKEYEDGSEEVRTQLESKYGKKYVVSLVNNSRAESWIKENSKPCPGCEVAIEKYYGCNKVVCWKCNVNFCWLCSEILDPSSPYTHYSDPNSRCAEKLFHMVYVFDSDEEDEDWDMVEPEEEEQ